MERKGEKRQHKVEITKTRFVIPQEAVLKIDREVAVHAGEVTLTETKLKIDVTKVKLVPQPQQTQ